MLFRKINHRLQKIEANQEKFTELMEKLKPMVEEYHAERIVRENRMKKVKGFSVIVGLVWVLVLIGTKLIESVK